MLGKGQKINTLFQGRMRVCLKKKYKYVTKSLFVFRLVAVEMIKFFFFSFSGNIRSFGVGSVPEYLNRLSVHRCLYSSFN